MLLAADILAEFDERVGIFLKIGQFIISDGQEGEDDEVQEVLP